MIADPTRDSAGPPDPEPVRRERAARPLLCVAGYAALGALAAGLILAGMLAFATSMTGSP